MRHFCAFGQEAHSLHEPKLLPPFSKRHTRLLLEESFYRPFAGAAHAAKLGECPVIAGIFHQYFGDPNQPRI
jgi:hypothetical protein